MPAFSVSKSITIAASPAVVREKIVDLHSWPEWSPWLIAERDAKVSYADDGKSYSWDGNIVGAGELTVISDSPSTINCDLKFIKPWKSQADVRFDLEAVGSEETKVTWAMDSALPFFMFFMKNMMVSMIGSDYDRGLMMLKSLLETGSIPSTVEFGETEVAAMNVLGVSATCAIKDVGSSMEESMGKVGGIIADSNLEPTQPPLSIYHKWDLGKQTCHYTIGAPFPAGTVAPSGLVSHFIPECRCYTVKHIGPYSYLGNAWSSIYSHLRGKQFVQDKKIAPFEIYENDPKEVDENGLVTVVHFPMK